jgi:hypothetical protein
MRNTTGLRRGGPGRPPGAPNKAPAKFRALLQDIVEEAFSSPQARRHLVMQLRTLRINPKVLQLVLAYAYGKPPDTLDVTHRSEISLAEIITGRIPEDEDSQDTST